ncbi:MAG: GNAT family N-acetyltransferase [Pseudomonadota bacterium]
MAKIRPIRKADIRDFREALGEVAVERKYLLTLETPSFDSIRTFVQNNIEKDYPQYVAEVDERIVGWADFVPVDKPSLVHCASLGMGVLKEHRRQGIGSALLDAVTRAALVRGFSRLELEVFANNRAAIALYEKYGFELEGTKRRARCIDGVFQDVLIMAQIVADA